ncbi:hypothetical protein Agub_g5723, partial [Astrephomene gubernaculifera]
MEAEDEPWNENDYTFERRRLTVHKKEHTEDPDYEQPHTHLHVTAQAEQEVEGDMVLDSGPQLVLPKSEVCCLVKGCHADLSRSKAYYRRFRICEAHMKSMSLSIEGRSCRFCQQCGKFHLVEEFDGLNRNCRKALMIRFYKRRNLPVTSFSRPEAEAAAAAAKAAAAAAARQHAETGREPRKRGRPRAPRPDIEEDDYVGANSGGSDGGGTQPEAFEGCSLPGNTAAARAAAAAGFDASLQAAYIAASRGFQGTGSGVNPGMLPATAIGPPGYSQGIVRMAGIEVAPEVPEDRSMLPAARKRRPQAKALAAAAAGAPSKLGRGPVMTAPLGGSLDLDGDDDNDMLKNQQGSADPDQPLGGGNSLLLANGLQLPPSLTGITLEGMTVEDMHAHIQAQVAAQVQAQLQLAAQAEAAHMQRGGSGGGANGGPPAGAAAAGGASSTGIGGVGFARSSGGLGVGLGGVAGLGTLGLGGLLGPGLGLGLGEGAAAVRYLQGQPSAQLPRLTGGVGGGGGGMMGGLGACGSGCGSGQGSQSRSSSSHSSQGRQQDRGQQGQRRLELQEPPPGPGGLGSDGGGTGLTAAGAAAAAGGAGDVAAPRRPDNALAALGAALAGA